MTNGSISSKDDINKSTNNNEVEEEGEEHVLIVNRNKDDEDSDDDESFSEFEDEQNSSRHDSQHSGEGRYAAKRQANTIAAAEVKALNGVRAFIVIVLISVTALVAQAVYYYLQVNEINDFNNAFEDQSETLLTGVGDVLRRAFALTDSFMVQVVSEATEFDDEWPYVIQPDFAVKSAKVLRLSRGSVLGLYPMVTDEQRDEWEAFALLNDGWVNASIDFQRRDSTYHGAIADAWNRSWSISNHNGPVPREEEEREGHGGEGHEGEEEHGHNPFYPSYYLYPIAPVNEAYNWDLAEGFGEALEAMEHDRAVVAGKTLNLGGNKEDKQTMQKIKGLNGVEPYATASEPLVTFFYPVVEHAAETLHVSEDHGHEGHHNVVGTFALTFYWKDLLQDILSPGADGLVVVIESDCGQALTYQIFGKSVVYLGDGDRHDREYNAGTAENYKDISLYLHELISNTNASSVDYSGFPMTDEYCPYRLTMYASDELKAQYIDELPLICMCITFLVFIVLACIFKCYDGINERRSKKTLNLAAQSAAVVANLFPPIIRDRLFKKEEEEKKLRNTKRVENARMRVQKFLGGEDEDDDEAVSQDGNEEMMADNQNAPIAELFSATTVMFADVVNFTAWSSIREPVQVFTLLEGVYSSFDRLARKRGVFKVETIGDSYVAVCGLPQPRVDHFIVMSKFARDVREKFGQKCSSLAKDLGPDTSDLELRIGLHSGPVTAGVLRGDKSRFQLFGDTVNTAARMESTGVPSKIQVSSSTAELLKTAGKSHWLTARDGGVLAKGKGELQTYFVEPSGQYDSSTNGSTAGSLDEDEFRDRLDEKTMRLVEWNAALLEKHLKQIVARREAWQSLPQKERAKSSFSYEQQDSLGGNQETTPLDEVKEVIELPEFSPIIADKTHSAESFQLGEKVLAQLKEYIGMIAAMYRTNAFHNFEHASHVTMSVSKLLSRIVAPSDLAVETLNDGTGDGKLASTLHDHTYGITSDPVTQFSCIFSALIHDVDHQGVSNAQLLEEDSPLALIYNGKSLAEQNSVDIAWKLFMEDQFEDLRNVICPTPHELEHFRHLVVNSVMATDLFDKDLIALRNSRWEKAFSEQSIGSITQQSQQRNRRATIVIEHLLQASDVAHTMQHWHIYQKWNEAMFKETYDAFKGGRGKSNPSDYWYENELAFFDAYILPLARKLSACGVFGVSSNEYLDYAMKNRDEWEGRGKELVAEMTERVIEKHFKKATAADPLLDISLESPGNRDVPTDEAEGSNTTVTHGETSVSAED